MGELDAYLLSKGRLISVEFDIVSKADALIIDVVVLGCFNMLPNDQKNQNESVNRGNGSRHGQETKQKIRQSKIQMGSPKYIVTTGKFPLKLN